MEIRARNVNDALNSALWWLKVAGVEETSRNGTVLAAPEPVTITYTQPLERVLWWPERDANPFFHLLESLWMLAGRNDVAFPATYAKQIAQYSDNGTHLNGAYGYRWSTWFKHDQLDWVVNELTQHRNTRRAVLGMWDPTHDPKTVHAGGKDVPCNTHIYFDIRDGALNMTVCNRSNDLIWGCCGANAVHFTFLLEYVAAMVGVPVGAYRQFTNNLHLYHSVPNAGIYLRPPTETPEDLYLCGSARPAKLMSADSATWHADLRKFFDDCDHQVGTAGAKYVDPFFMHTVRPLMWAHAAYKTHDMGAAMHWVGDCAATDWALACTQWLQRRAK